MRLSGFAWVIVLGVPQAAMAQQAVAPMRLAPESPWTAPARNPQDAAIVQRSQAQRSAIENEVKDYLVPLRAWDGKSRPPVGISLLANGTGPVDMVWDTATHSMVAQWRLVQKTDSGQRLYYTTSVGESGALNFSISTRF